MSLEAKLLLQEFRTLVAEFGDKLPMTERYRESLLNRLHAELKSLRPEARESIAIPRSTLEAWHGALDAHRSDSSDEAEWNNYGVIEVDDAIIELLREPQSNEAPK